MFLYQMCSAFESANISYAIAGGYAVALHGVIRGTMDIDIVVEWTLDNLKKVEEALKEVGLVSLLPIDANSVFHFRDEYINNRNLIAWNFYDPKNLANQVDVIINFNLQPNHTKTFSTAKGKVKVLSVKDLIAMKKNAGRKQDLEDVAALEAL